MTKQELFKFLEYLNDCGILKNSFDERDYDRVIWEYQEKLKKVLPCKCGVLSEHFMCDECRSRKIKELTKDIQNEKD